MSAGITAIDLVDSDLLKRLKSAVDTTKTHYAEKGGSFVNQVIAHLVEVVHELSTRATMYPVALVSSRIHLDDETKELVRCMQTVIDEHPADMAERLDRLATKMQERMKSSTPMDDGTLWLPDEHVKQCEKSYEQRLSEQRAALCDPDHITYDTVEPEFEEIGEEAEPGEYDADDSDDERNIVLTKENYPMEEYPLDAES
ncbi:hypothetical protein AG0111_0g8696 [Alternaria gaisen]|uniref:Uncharacterized protein n=1 Tax=Alternaria gaisen TaxID=167740 RepID=A0ACB6FDY0_9PLEO|nr:hypothetical protein AG0111_0g8696 [Alternaria gaisen]